MCALLIPNYMARHLDIGLMVRTVTDLCGQWSDLVLAVLSRL